MPLATSSSTQDPLVGQTLHQYRIVDILGSGGMSTVYRADHLLDQTPVAIKILHPFLAVQPECRARLAREAHAAARILHPNVVRVIDAEQTDTYLVTELVEGLTLRRFAERHHIWHIPEIGAFLVWQIALALASAHQCGVIHRDIKPENIMIRLDGVVKLMDFGIAHVVDQRSLTVSGTILGSPAHLAPECLDGKTADQRSDIFSLGTVLYWLTTGSLPFDAPTPHALLKSIALCDYLPPNQRAPHLPNVLVNIITRCMAASPNDRFESADDLADALSAMLIKSGISPDEEELQNILRDPTTQFPQLQREIWLHALQEAERFIDKGISVKALPCLNRLLADDKLAEDSLHKQKAILLLDEIQQGDASLPPEPASITQDTQEILQIPPAFADFSDTASTSTQPHQPQVISHTQAVSPRSTDAIPAQDTESATNRVKKQKDKPPYFSNFALITASTIASFSLIFAAFAGNIDVMRWFSWDSSDTRTENRVGIPEDLQTNSQANSQADTQPEIEIDPALSDLSIRNADMNTDNNADNNTDSNASNNIGNNTASSDAKKSIYIPDRLLRAVAAKEKQLASGRGSHTNLVVDTHADGTDNRGINHNGNYNAGQTLVVFHSRPYADIEVDGRLVGDDTTHTEAYLDVGKHEVVFRNAMAIEERRQFTVEAGKKMELRVSLEPKAARLVVESVPPDADILLIDDKDRYTLKGTAKNSQRNPIVIPLQYRGDRLDNRVRIAIHSVGYRPVTLEKTLTPGDTTKVHVELIRDTNTDSDDPPSRRVIAP